MSAKCHRGVLLRCDLKTRSRSNYSAIFSVLYPPKLERRLILMWECYERPLGHLPDVFKKKTHRVDPSGIWGNNVTGKISTGNQGSSLEREQNKCIEYKIFGKIKLDEDNCVRFVNPVAMYPLHVSTWDLFQKLAMSFLFTFHFSPQPSDQHPCPTSPSPGDGNGNNEHRAILGPPWSIPPISRAITFYCLW